MMRHQMISGLNYVYMNRRTSKSNLSCVKSFWIRSAGVRTSTDEATERTFSFPPWLRNQGIEFVDVCVCVVCVGGWVRVISWFAFIYINLYLIVKNQLSPPLLRFACSPHYSVSLVRPLSSYVALAPRLTAREPDMHIDCYNMLFDAAWTAVAALCFEQKRRNYKKWSCTELNSFASRRHMASNLLLPVVARKNLYFNS